MNRNPLYEIIGKRRQGIHCGIPSYCSANKFVIEAVITQAKRRGEAVLVESTSNQVNQFGGYINMTPADYRDFVFEIADRLGFDRSKLILGGDHLGPQPWQKLPEAEAMANSRELVRLFTLAGYQKIHLDTSMRVGDDDPSKPLSDETIARRGAELMKVCEEAYQERLKSEPDAVHPVFIIGSEVPIPGGAQDDEGLQVTKPEAFEATVKTYRKVFEEYGISGLWQYVIAVVVQPGVEFGDAEVHRYRREEAKKLTERLSDYPDLVFEGHSTDYQSPKSLKEMVEDGIAILKVGPALTFAAREALYALSFIENELVEDESKRSHFIETLEAEMLAEPKDWQKYYKGTEQQKAIARKYSYSDRSRYYMSRDAVEAAREKLFENIRSLEIPAGLLMQYLPRQYARLRDGLLRLDPHDIVIDSVIYVADDYNYAVC